MRDLDVAISTKWPQSQSCDNFNCLACLTVIQTSDCVVSQPWPPKQSFDTKYRNDRNNFFGLMGTVEGQGGSVSQ